MFLLSLFLKAQIDKARSLEALIFELERAIFPTLIVSHASTLQVLYGYFLGQACPPDSYFSLFIPQHVVIELIPHQYGWRETRYDLSSMNDYIQLQQSTITPCPPSLSSPSSPDIKTTSNPTHSPNKLSLSSPKSILSSTLPTYSTILSDRSPSLILTSGSNNVTHSSSVLNLHSNSATNSPNTNNSNTSVSQYPNTSNPTTPAVLTPSTSFHSTQFYD